MTRRRIALLAAASFAGLLLILTIAAVFIVQTAWFRNLVREKIVSSIEKATGGQVTIRSFSFEWLQLRAGIDDLVLHGLEPPGVTPLLRVKHIEIDLKLVSPFKGFADIQYLGVDSPQVHLLVFPDGHTNVPPPKTPRGKKSDLEQIVDLAIGRFDLRDGSFLVNEERTNFKASGANLRAALTYNSIAPRYSGQIDIRPLEVKLGRNSPAEINVKLPITLEKDKITLTGAQLQTGQSQILVSASVEHLAAPRASADIRARVALDELQRTTGLMAALDTKQGPRVLNAEVTASLNESYVQIQSARLNLGGSAMEVSGKLNDSSLAGALEFRSTLALGQLGRLLRVSAQPDGVARVYGKVALRGANDYLIDAKVDAHDIAVRQDGARLSGINLDSNFIAGPRRIEAKDLRLSALGGSFEGSGSLEDLARYRVQGNLSHFDLDQIARAILSTRLGYSGTISGPVRLDGNLKRPADIAAQASLAIAPGSGGIPLSGRLNAEYAGSTGAINVGRSYLVLPHSRLDFSGELQRQMQIHLVTRDASDFQPLASVPVSFQGGSATVSATLTGNIRAMRISGQMAANNFAIEGRPFTRLDAAFNASSSSASVTQATLARGPLEAQFSATVGLRGWKPEPAEPLRAEVMVRNADVRDVLALAGQKNPPVTGSVEADLHIDGTIGSPSGSGNLTVVNGSVDGQPFDTLTAHVISTQTEIQVPAFQLIAGPSRMEASATYDHQVNDLERGVLRARLASNQIQLAQVQQLAKDRPGLAGIASLNADAVVDVQPSTSGEQFQLTSLQGNASVRGLQMEGKSFGDFTAAASTAGSSIQYNVNSNFAGSTIRVRGESALAGGRQTKADASITNLPIESVLALAGRRDLPLRGTLNATAELSGTAQDPHATAAIEVARGSAYQEPFDRMQAELTYSNQSIEVPHLRIEDGPANIELSGSFLHPAGDFQDGNIQFSTRAGGVQLSRLHIVQHYKPGLAGELDWTADGAATLRRDAIPLFSTLNARLVSKGLTVDRKPVGDVTAVAETQGNHLNFNLQSNFAHANIRGAGRMDLGGDYPLNAEMSFSNMTYSGLGDWLGRAPAGFDATLDGEAHIAGPAARAAALQGELDLTKIEVHSAGLRGGKARLKFEAHNTAPMVLALDNSKLVIRNAAIVGPDANLAFEGSVDLAKPQTLDLRANGDVKLEMLEAANTNVFSSGSVTLHAVASGTLAKPAITGALELHNASFNTLDLPVGLSNANGTIAFNGNQAQMQNVTAESGGGKVTLAGYIAYGGAAPTFHLQATVDRIHVTYPETLTTEADARLTLTGSAANSLLSGTVTVRDMALHPKSDLTSILMAATAPSSAPPPSPGILAGVRFDVRIETAQGLQLRTSLAQNLQADFNLTLRGTADHPGMLGRAEISEGEALVLGSKYTIDQGIISFFDPQKIDPILDVTMETTVQGVNVNINISGHLDRLKLSYSSDPPMQFNDLVALLAAGRAPTTDPVLAARQPPQSQQSLQQVGSSFLLEQTLANPVAGRLQRLFGVTQLKVDPQFTGSSATPQATLTVQQQVTHDISLTYSQDLTQSNTQTVRVEWAINRIWSAALERDLNGEVFISILYKRRLW